MAGPSRKTERFRKEMEAMGQRMKDVRESAGFTMQEAADIVGVSHQQLYKYESGQTSMSSTMLFFLAKGYGVPITAFYSNTATEVNNPGFASIIRELRLLMPNERNAVAQMLRGLNRSKKNAPKKAK